MSLLSSAIEQSGLIFSLYTALLLLMAVLFWQRRRKVLALGLINQQGLMGLAALIAIPFISPFAVPGPALAAAILVDAFYAGVFLFSGLAIVRFLQTRAHVVTDRQVAILLGAKLMFFAANYFAADGQYGIFSDDSRIDFLAVSPLLSKTRYLDNLIDFVVLLSIGAKCMLTRRVRLFDLSVLLATVAFGLLAGSKGGTLLNAAYAALFVHAAFPRAVSLRIKVWIVIALAGIAATYMFLLSDLLQVSFSQLVGLTTARFVLSADARLMAFDPEVTQYVLSQPHGSLLAELFRGVARAMGAFVAEFSMGVYQFQAQLGTTNYVGSTSQLSALLVTYGGDFWLGEFLIVAALVIAVTWYFLASSRSRSPAVQWVSVASLYQLNSTVAQGFEAYVQLLPICVALVLAVWLLPQLSLRRRRYPVRFMATGEASS